MPDMKIQMVIPDNLEMAQQDLVVVVMVAMVDILIIWDHVQDPVFMAIPGMEMMVWMVVMAVMVREANRLGQWIFPVILLLMEQTALMAYMEVEVEAAEAAEVVTMVVTVMEAVVVVVVPEVREATRGMEEKEVEAPLVYGLTIQPLWLNTVKYQQIMGVQAEIAEMEGMVVQEAIEV